MIEEGDSETSSELDEREVVRTTSIADRGVSATGTSGDEGGPGDDRAATTKERPGAEVGADGISTELEESSLF